MWRRETLIADDVRKDNHLFEWDAPGKQLDEIPGSDDDVWVKGFLGGANSHASFNQVEGGFHILKRNRSGIWVLGLIFSGDVTILWLTHLFSQSLLHQWPAIFQIGLSVFRKEGSKAALLQHTAGVVFFGEWRLFPAIRNSEQIGFIRCMTEIKFITLWFDCRQGTRGAECI